jgi:flagellar hook-associated protein 1 FlgK
MSQGSLIGIGSSALRAYSQALQVTGHNIANAGNDGYSRQRLEVATTTPDLLQFGAIGNGVQARAVSRVTDDYLQTRISGGTSSERYQQTMLEFSRDLDNLLADGRSGLAPVLQEFFAAAEDVAADPGSIAARQQLLARAGSVTDRFGQLEAAIADQRELLSGRVKTAVDEINQLSASIAQLNGQIVEARSIMGGRPPNDLLDQRDQLVLRLAEKVSVSTVPQGDGAINVYVGRGQALVVGREATPMFTGAMGADPERTDVSISNGSSMVVVTDFLTGGELGALFEVRGAVLDQASNALGRIAVAFADSVNATQARHMDLGGRPGEPMFGWSMPAPLARPGNAAQGVPTVALADASALQASDYELRFDGAAWTVRRLQDGSVQGTVAPGGQLSVDGLGIDLGAVAGAAAGDVFLLQPLRVADRLETRLGDPRAVAAALPVTAEPAIGNAGSLTVQRFEVEDPADPALRTPLAVRATAGGFEIDGQTFAADPSGETTIEVNGWRLVLRGQPAEGDVVEIRDNSGASGDNRGARALAALADDGVLAGGTVSFGDAYASLVADVGVRTRRAEINAATQSSLLGEARSKRESISGVNLDEEAANLLRYQQAYQAAAQVVSVANSLFDTLLAAVRR